MIDWDYEKSLMFEIVRLKEINAELMALLQEAQMAWDDENFNWDDWDDKTRATIARGEGQK